MTDPSPAPPAHLPLTRRDELVRDQLAHLPLGSRRFADAPAPVRVGIAGSGPELLVLAWSAPALARERVAGTRVLRHVGLRPGMRIANTLPGALATPGALLLGDVVEQLGGLDVPLGSLDGAPAARQAWELLERVRPAAIVLDPSSAVHLFAAPAPAETDWWAGIVWLQHGASAARPAPPAWYAGWERVWLAVPEATSFVGGTCVAGSLHVDEGVVAEVVDERSATVVPTGAAGVLALTPLGGDVPLLRYASTLRARVVPRCPCGGRAVALALV